MSSEPGIYNFEVSQGSTINRVVTLTDENDALINLTGYTARMQIRRNADGDLIHPTNAEFVSGTGLTIDGPAGTVTLNITAAQSATWPATTAVYSLELYAATASGVRTEEKVIAGRFVINREVTR